MPVMTIQELYAEANNLSHYALIPRNAGDLLNLLNKFCYEHDLEWGLERGSAFDFCVFIINNKPNGWMLEFESGLLNDAIIMSTVEAWQRITAPGNVIYLEEWRQRNNR